MSGVEATTHSAAEQPTGQGGDHPPLIELRGVSKCYGAAEALADVSFSLRAGEVLCVLGDNGAGKSTLIKIIAGRHAQSSGELLVEGESVRFESPRQALARGIATVYQDLAVVPLMPVWRNFFLGNELTVGVGPFRRLDRARMREVALRELRAMGVELRSAEQPVGTLSGGERQSIAIARAVYFGAKVLILDEPTAALGVKQAGAVLRYIRQARDRGLGVIYITHNPLHAHPVGDEFLLLRQGRVLARASKGEVSVEQLTRLMSGAADEADDVFATPVSE